MFKNEMRNILSSCSRYSFSVDESGKLKTDENELSELIDFVNDKIEGFLKKAYTQGFVTGGLFIKDNVTRDLATISTVGAPELAWHGQDNFDRWIAEVEDKIRPVILSPQ